uniref:uncharacterized protein LOC120336495 isoform X1 n=1 Tax=Styela clava TaxID=7725 RepID=UPI00193AB1CA|nr:uncharacterized protein LOC120336495 isoform X1 [Styela clava]
MSSVIYSIVVVCYLIFFSINNMISYPAEGCHHGLHRKKREAGSALTVQEFFPGCMRNLSADIPRFENRSWEGSVAFTLFHSTWYEVIGNETCIDAYDTIECWNENLPDYISNYTDGVGKPALRLAQECVVEYYNQFFGLNVTITAFPTGSNEPNDSTCIAVNESYYKTELVADLNTTELESGDQTVNEIDDTVAFVIDDMICPNCTCADLFANDEYVEEYEFESGISCGDCWTTRLATSTREKSPIRKTGSKLAVKKSGVKRIRRCARDPIPESDYEIVNDLLQMNISCFDSYVELRISACGLATLNYRQATELAIADPTSTDDVHFSQLDDECKPVVKRRNQPLKKEVFFNFTQSACDAYVVQVNPDEVNYVYGLRTLEPDFKYQEDEVLRRILLNLNITCRYQSVYRNTIPFGAITIVSRTVSVNLASSIGLSVTMTVYRDSDFNETFTSENSEIIVPDKIWLRFTHDGSLSEYLEIDACWITPDENRENPILYEIIKDGCTIEEDGVNIAKELHTCESNVASFGFESFMWGAVADSNELHLHCDVISYLDTDPYCGNKSCQGTRRRKRSISKKSTTMGALFVGSSSNLCTDKHGQSCSEIYFGCDEYGKPKCRCSTGRKLKSDGLTCEPL